MENPRPAPPTTALATQPGLHALVADPGASAGRLSPAVVKILITPGASQLRRIRGKLRNELATQRGVGPGHVTDVELVANELVGASFEAGIRKPLTLRVELLTRLTSVRVRCPSSVELRDEPFGLRERVLQHVAFAWGSRTYRDGSVDLWAEIARPVVPYAATP